MFFVIFLTEKCNLTCRYCEPPLPERKTAGHITYTFEDLRHFVSRHSDCGIQLYGGEPLLNMPLLEKIVEELPFNLAVLQTNGLLLNRLSEKCFSRIDAISISIDGPSRITDSYRGRNCYRRAIEGAVDIRKRGYRGPVRARMTITPGVPVQDAVMHLVDSSPFTFDNIHWQLNVMFNREDWKEKEKIREWFLESYNPGISRLVEYWMSVMIGDHKVLNILPFSGIAHTLVTGRYVNNFRCGAGGQMLAITTSGDLYPCPVMRHFPRYRMGNIGDPPSSPPAVTLLSLSTPCTRCDIFHICGGRCLCAHLENQWDREGFDLVCNSVRHLVGEIRKFAPHILDLMRKGHISAGDFREDYFTQTEVIP